MVGFSSKDLFERYAILVLMEVYDSRLITMYNDQKSYESPDWQSRNLQIGIEVTQALDELEGEERSIINKVFGNGYSPQEVIDMVNKLSNGKMNGKVKDYNGLIAYSYHNGLFSYKFHINKILNSLEVKHRKLNFKFATFKENWLYIYSGTSTLHSHDFDPIIIEYKKLCEFSEFKFQKIFIDCIIHIFIIDENFKVSYVELEDEKRLEINKRVYRVK